MYSGGGGNGNTDRSMRGSGVGNNKCTERTDPALDLASNSYSNFNVTW